MQNRGSAPPRAMAGPAAFAAALQSEQEALGAFIRLLQTEQEILVSGDADRLAALGPDKAAQIELLGQLGEDRKRHLAAQNLPDNADGILAWMTRNSTFAAPVRKIWRELLARAETARQLNETNGKLIDGKLQQNRLKLAVLQSAAGSDGVYCADGQFKPRRAARPLDQA